MFNYPKSTQEWRNAFQSVFLILFLLSLSCFAGYFLSGNGGFWIAFTGCLLVLLIEPMATPYLTLRMYRARPISDRESPELCILISQIAQRAGLKQMPELQYFPAIAASAFAVGNSRKSFIALSDGLLNTLNLREIAGVLAHETAHIARGDLRVMNMADFVSRLTWLLSIFGQILLLLELPILLEGQLGNNLLGLILLVFSPYLAILAQLGLSRVREFDADHEAALLTGDPLGFARALEKIELTEGRANYWVPNNPNPSWLRTHPLTKERVRRLLALVK